MGAVDDTSDPGFTCEATKADDTPDATSLLTGDTTATNESSQESITDKCNKHDDHQIAITVCLLRLPSWLASSGLSDIRREHGSCSTLCPCCNSAILSQEDNLGDSGWHAQGKQEHLAQRLLTAIGGGAQARSIEEARAKQIQICENILPRAMPLSIFATKNLVGGMLVIQPQHLEEAVTCSRHQQVRFLVKITMA